MPPAAPRFGPGDVVYLIASANRGFIESYRVSQARSVGDGYLYAIRIRPHREKDEIPTVGDRNDLRSTGYLEFSEDELGTFCEVLPLARQYLTTRLMKIESLIIAHDCEGPEGSG